MILGRSATRRAFQLRTSARRLFSMRHLTASRASVSENWQERMQLKDLVP